MFFSDGLLRERSLWPATAAFSRRDTLSAARAAMSSLPRLLLLRPRLARAPCQLLPRWVGVRTDRSWQAPVNTTVPLDPAVDIEGAYVNVLNQVAALSNITARGLPASRLRGTLVSRRSVTEARSVSCPETRRRLLTRSSQIIYEAPWLPLPIRLTEDRIAQFNYIFDVLKCASGEGGDVFRA